MGKLLLCLSPIMLKLLPGPDWNPVLLHLFLLQALLIKMFLGSIWAQITCILSSRWNTELLLQGSNSSLVFAVQNSNIPIRAFIFIYIFNEVVPDFNKSCSRDLCLCPYYLLPNISGTDRKVYMGYPRRFLDLRESKKSTEETVWYRKFWLTLQIEKSRIVLHTDMLSVDELKSVH